MTNAAKSILVVDDDAELCVLIGEVLTASGEFRVEAVHDGRRCLGRVLASCFDLIILDVMLPVVDGFEVLTQIRKRSRVPVILLTSRTERPDRVAGFDAGADDYLPKPFWPEELEPAFTSFVAKAIYPLWHGRSKFWSGNSELN